MSVELSGDQAAVLVEIATAQAEDREISDACARVIGSWYAGGQGSAGAAFASTGAVDVGGLWRELSDAAPVDRAPWERVALDMLGTYLVRCGDRGPVEGWFRLWVR